jgi:hypothetical protein
MAAETIRRNGRLRNEKAEITRGSPEGKSGVDSFGSRICLF